MYGDEELAEVAEVDSILHDANGSKSVAHEDRGSSLSSSDQLCALLVHELFELRRKLYPNLAAGLHVQLIESALGVSIKSSLRG